MGLISKIFGTYSERELKRIEPLVQQTMQLEEKYAAMNDDELRSQTDVLKERLTAGETLDDILPDAFAVCREGMYRSIGIKPYQVQVVGGIVLHQGRIAEMKTGEGKTFVAALPSYLNALAGKGVHVITVNEYLAKYGSEQIGRVHNFLGLSVGLITHDMDNNERRAAYAADVTYGTNNEFGFDYLRDNMVVQKEERVQRKFSFAIVDEVDSILIDEARTPLIISGRGDKPTDLYNRADDLVKKMKLAKVVELDNKEAYDETFDAKFDYVVDEKAKTATLLPSGVKRTEEFFHIENLMDSENLTLLHHVNQAIKAHGCMHLDTEYVIKDGEIVIVDEFTGRLMFGRRFNEGLHQAIEAKEHVKVKSESKTLATVTFQNFFRLYEKLSGMTGTASTEATEFQGIYSLDVIEIPTNRPVIRIDSDDQVYKNESGKYSAVIKQIAECHAKGQPVLVGTVSIEKSEHLSHLLKHTGIKHNVLNAKQHAKEAEIIAQAGHFGAVTIATNMAGRGTDIMLGGNSEYKSRSQMRAEGFEEDVIFEAMGFSNTEDEHVLKARERFRLLNEKFKEEIVPEAEKVKAVGGLFILGTERHESRRIDNQLRGRAGRQGDPGESRFFISLEDDLMRIFGGERVQRIMETLKIEDDEPIQNGLLSKTIESSQKKIEGQHYSARKNVLDFDDVMNQQRKTIYGQRGKVLDGEDVSDNIKEMLQATIDDTVVMFCADESADNWNLEGLRGSWSGLLTNSGDFRYTVEELNSLKKDDIHALLLERAEKAYAAKEAEINETGKAVNIDMRELERVVLLKNVDSKWMEHIDAMADLRQGIYMQSMGQGRDPVVEYRVQGFQMFDAMIGAIREDTVRHLLGVKLRIQEPPKREQVLKPTQTNAPSEQPQQRTVKKKPGPNDPCYCGSGKKYKKCHMEQDNQVTK
ncbi:MAG: preprotein translocase subunit SecA [Oscillospiraceae bacterium]|jgi:preprotein translocase subunit SecA|nr:preprotein translocase subunit SecA [Oscillospiraceae bacterium]